MNGLLRAALLAAVVSLPLRAQTAPPGAAPAEAMPAFERPNGLLLRAMSASFHLTLTRGDQITPLGVRTVDVSETSAAGLPAWLVAETRSGTPVTTVDSLVLSRADLSPIRWAATAGASALAVSLTRDSLFGAMQTYQGRSSFATALPAGALLTPGMVEQIVPLLPFRDGYRTGAALVLLEMAETRVLPAELAVERSERCSVAGRAEDCWVVALRAGAIEERLWVTRGSPRVVRTEQATAMGLVTATIDR